jgi:hypothetical protein
MVVNLKSIKNMLIIQLLDVALLFKHLKDLD